jgi:Zn-dependent protease
MSPFVIRALIQFPLLLFSITIHEYCHGLIAERRGDDTARLLGRLTLNPIAHIDLFGTILLPLLAMISGFPLFGWAKPVPINPLRLYSPRSDMMYIGLAGPAANFSLAVASALILRFIISSGLFVTFVPLFHYLLIINVILAVFNLIPVPPLDGSHILGGLLPRDMAYQYERIKPYGFIIIIFLLYSGILWAVLMPIVRFIIRLLGGGI